MKIIISVALAIFLLGCSDDTSSSSAKKEEILKQVNATTQTQSVAVEPTQKVIQEDIKTAVIVAEDTTVEVLEEVTEKTVEKVEVAVAQVVVSKSGADLFKACSSCHGQSGEKKALNKSQIIQGWDSTKVSSALNGYKEGSYGEAMKGLMKSQVIKLSDADIAALAKYISEL